MNAFSHQLKPGISAYVVPGDPSSGHLPGIDPEPMAEPGTADHRVQAYNFRFTLTNHPENRRPIEKPADYDPRNYELLLRHLAAHAPDEWPRFWINSPMPNRKTDTNAGGGFSSNLVGQNWHWPTASYDERDAYAARLRRHILGFLWTLQNHPSIRPDIRDHVREWGLPKDEYIEHGNFTPQVYVRVGRRMIGELVVTQHHCERLRLESDIVGMAAYGMDSHGVRRYITAEGHVRNEGNVQGHVTAPYGVSYRALLPKRAQATNLIVPVAVSSTHIAFGSIRMEPVFMILGQSAATAAGLALEKAPRSTTSLTPPCASACSPTVNASTTATSPAADTPRDGAPPSDAHTASIASAARLTALPILGQVTSSEHPIIAAAALAA
jgi:hypothetical protein